MLAGGAGERFWPRSRAGRPKPFLQLLGGGSLLDATLTRARRFTPEDQLWIVCGAEHAGFVRRETGLPARRVLVEPQRRNTAMAIGFAALRIAADDPEALLAVLPADHHIPDARSFAAAVRKAARAADRASVLVTLGVRPSRPETGYGYIQVGAPVGPPHEGLFEVRRFVEKPSAARARRFLARGGFTWNAGIFVWKVRTILEELERCAPDLHAALAPLRRSPRGRGMAQAVRAAYRRAPSLPIDIAVLERSPRLWTLPVEWHWSDVGTWRSLADELGVDASTTRVIDGDALLQDADGNLVWGDGGRTVVLLGVSGLAVIDAGDALLVASLERSPELRGVVERLKKSGRAHLT